MNLTRKRHLPYRGDWRLIVSGQHKHSRRYWGEDFDPPPYHPERYFMVRNTYSSRIRGLVIKEQSDSCYETSSVTTFLEMLWNEISPSPHDDIFFDWMEYMGKKQNERAKRRTWGEPEDITKLLSKRIQEYFPAFNLEENKHLLLRILRTLGE